MSEGHRERLVPADVARAIWSEIAACVERQKELIYEQIRSYPTPITGCDQQFNFLLKRQARVSDELARLRKVIGDIAIDGSPIDEIVGFLQSSTCIDDARKRQIQSRLAGPPSVSN
jgi:hypothetical protein